MDSKRAAVRGVTGRMVEITIPPLPSATTEVKGDPKNTEEMVKRLTEAASGVEGQQDFATDVAPKGVGRGGDKWEGKSADAYLGGIAPFAQETSIAHTGLTQGAAALQDYADDLRELVARRDGLETERSNLSASITNLKARIDELPDDPDEAAVKQLQAEASSLDLRVTAYEANNNQLKTDTESNEQELVSALNGLTGIEPTNKTMAAQGYNPEESIQSALRKMGPNSNPTDIGRMTPEQQAQWWANLNPHEQQAVLQEFPEYISPSHTGFPAKAHDTASRQLLYRDIVQSEAALRSGTGFQPEARMVLDNAKATLKGLERGEVIAAAAEEKAAKEGRIVDIPVQLYSYDARAFGGVGGYDGKAIISIGDMDKAKNVVFNVPGISNSVDTMESNVQQAGNLFNQANGSDGNTASVMWMGYDAPSDFDYGNTISAGAAIDGGNLLAADIDGFNASRDQLGMGQGQGAADRLNMTVIGHSYGSTTVSYAGSDLRMVGDVDQVTLIGSPGTGPIFEADQFGIGANNVYAGADSDDFVTKIAATTHNWDVFGVPAAMGNDPAMDSFGGVRFQAEGNAGPWSLDSHTSYYNEGSESLDNLGRIVTGNDADTNGDGILDRDTDGAVNVNKEAHRYRTLWGLTWEDPADSRPR